MSSEKEILAAYELNAQNQDKFQMRNIAFEGKKPGKVHSYRIREGKLSFYARNVITRELLPLETLFKGIDKTKAGKDPNDEEVNKNPFNPVTIYLMNGNVEELDRNPWNPLFETIHPDTTPKPEGGVRVYSYRDTYYTITKPETGPYKGVVIYSKGNAWDLGSFHRVYKNRPYAPDYREYAEKVRGELEADSKNLKLFNTWLEHQDPIKGQTSSLAQILANATGCMVLCYEYPGYGACGDVTDMVKAPLYLCQMIEGLHDDKLQGINPFKPGNSEPSRYDVYLFGYSVGCAVTIKALYALKSNIYSSDLKYYNSIKGVILQSAFSSMNETGDPRQKAVAFLSERSVMSKFPGGYQSKVLIRALDKPIVFVHGAADEVCSTKLAFENLYKPYRYSVDFQIVGVGHNDLPSQREYPEVISRCIEQLSETSVNSEKRITKHDDLSALLFAYRQMITDKATASSGGRSNPRSGKYESMTVKELRDRCVKRRIKWIGLRKAELIIALRGSAPARRQMKKHGAII